MKFMQGITITLLTALLAVVGYELTMTITTLGGYLPLALITAGPAFGYAIARATS
jgi:hypothetical protein